MPSSLAGLRLGAGRAPLGGSIAPRTTPHHFTSDAPARPAKTQVRMALTPNPLIRMRPALRVAPLRGRGAATFRPRRLRRQSEPAMVATQNGATGHSIFAVTGVCDITSARGLGMRGHAAIEIRCAGHGGRCRLLLAVAYTVPGRRRDGAVVHVENTPGMRVAGMPRYEHRVAADWSGVIPGEVISCSKHPVWFPVNHPAWRPGTSLPRIPISAEPMPCALLRDAYQRHLHSGKPELVKWLPRQGDAGPMLGSG